MATLLTALLLSLPVHSQEAPPALQEPQPRYELHLTLAEFSILHSAAAVGIATYGGEAGFQVNLAKRGDAVEWEVSVDQPRLMEAWKLWMAEKTAVILGTVDIQALPATSLDAILVCQSLNRKLDQALASPIWPEVQLVGFIKGKRGAVVLDVQGTTYSLAGDVSTVEAYLDSEVVWHGRLLRGLRLETLRCIPVKQNTLEVFVMSHCPYAKQALAALIPFVDSMGDGAPRIEIHYLFYKGKLNDGSGFRSLHGMEEIEENLVQMTLRDLYPDSEGLFRAYLLARTSSNARWQDLATSLGLKKKDLDAILEHVSSSRDEMMEAEYQYATASHGIFDGSPTFVWESQVVRDIRLAGPFRGLDLTLNPDLCRGPSNF